MRQGGGSIQPSIGKGYRVSASAAGSHATRSRHAHTIELNLVLYLLFLQQELEGITVNDYKHCSKIAEIQVMKDLIMTLSDEGVCSMFNRYTSQFIAVLNKSADERVRRVHYNSSIHSVIVVFTSRYDNFSSLRCRTAPLSYVPHPIALLHTDGCRNLHDLDWRPMFKTESFKYPAFLEFDDINKKVITFCAAKKYVILLTSPARSTLFAQALQSVGMGRQARTYIGLQRYM